MSKYLDTSGLTYFWEKIKTYVDNKISSVSAGVISFKGRSGAVTPASGDYTASMVGADPTGTADSAVSTHNTSTTAHSDIRTELAGKETAGAAATVQSNLDSHAANTTLHITADERTAWNAKEAGGAAAAVQSNLDTHVADTTAHITADERTAWNAKQAAITGAASTIATSDLTASRVMVTNTSGKAATSSITTTKLGYLSGVTSSIQTQLNAKLPKTGGTLTGGLTMGTNNAITFTNGDGDSTADMFNLNEMFAHGEGVGILTSGQGGNLTYLDVVDGGIYIGDDCDNNIQIHGVGTPAADADAANKSYVDTAVSGVSSSVTELSTTVSGVSSSVTELSKKVSSKGDMFRDVYDPDKDGCVLDADNAKKLKKAVNITIGNATKSFDGSAAISFSADEIGVNSSGSSSGGTAGVSSFNGRSGAVSPASGDYTASMVGADASGTASSAVSSHNSDTSAHSDIRTALNGKETAGAAAAVQSSLDSHTGDTTIHVTAAEKTVWNAKETGGAAAAVQSNLTSHTGNSTVHITSSERTTWNAKASKPTKVTISLSTTWTGSASPYTQTVTVSGGTSTCKVDLQPDATAFAHMVSVGCNALFIVNNSGTFTAYAIGAKTTTALSIQATVTEVS